MAVNRIMARKENCRGDWKTGKNCFIVKEFSGPHRNYIFHDFLLFNY